MAAITIVRTARKRRSCDVCHVPIEPGEKYEYHSLTPHDNDIRNLKWWHSATHLKNCYGTQGERQ